MKLTEFTDEQIEWIDEIEQSCFPDPWDISVIRTETESPLCDLLVEEADGRIIGFALAKTAADEAELYQLAVLPAYRRRGIARRLLRKLYDAVRERGAAMCFLEVRSGNAEAIALYESEGFERISVRTCYYGDDDALIYRLGFEPEESENGDLDNGEQV